MGSVLCSLAVSPGSGGQHADKALGPLSMWLGCSAGGCFQAPGPTRGGGGLASAPTHISGPGSQVCHLSSLSLLPLPGCGRPRAPLDHRKCLVNARGDGDAHGHAAHGQSWPRARLPPRAAPGQGGALPGPFVENRNVIS